MQLNTLNLIEKTCTIIHHLLDINKIKNIIKEIIKIEK